MQPLILMLRGVNVSGANRLPMADFRAMLAGLGLMQVQTYIQSGNAVFVGARDGLEARIAAGLAGMGLQVPVFLLSVPEMEAILQANPYQAAGAVDGAKVHVIFLQGEVRFDAAGFAALATMGEEFHLGAGALYLHTPLGFGKSAVAEKLPRFLKAATTARNQRSCAAILALARSLTGS